MSTWDIKLWQSVENWNYCNDNYSDADIALKRAKTYIEGAFSRVSNETANVTLGTDSVHAPVEACRQSFTAQYPCGKLDKDYSSLLAWWKDWLDCENARVTDSNMLITNGDIPGGGYSSSQGDDGTVSSGKFLPDASSSYTEYHSKSDPYKAVAATLHEVGHNVMIQGGYHHQRGNTYHATTPSFDGDVNTPQGPVDGSYNYCDDPHDGSQPNVALKWSDCSKNIIYK